jgi:hypothetical protein
MVHDEIDENSNPPLLGAVRELDEVAQRAVTRIHIVVVGDVIAIIAPGRSLERHQPYRGDAEPGQIV